MAVDLNQLNFAWLRGDEWFDQVVWQVEEADFLQARTAIRYKTSGLSGNEWRTSTVFEMSRKGAWEEIHVSGMNLERSLAAFYGQFYSTFPDMVNLPCTQVSLFRKGVELLNLHYQEGMSLPLIHALGHMPHVFTEAFERQEGVYGWHRVTETHWWTRCFQPGCPEAATITFRLKHSICNQGGHHPNATNAHRRYCARHAIRGDSDMEDCDQNNITVDGDRRGAGPKPEDISPAVFGGVIEVK